MTHVAWKTGIAETKSRAPRELVNRIANANPISRYGAPPTIPHDLMGMSIVLRILADRASAFGGVKDPTANSNRAQSVLRPPRL